MRTDSTVINKLSTLFSLSNLEHLPPMSAPTTAPLHISVSAIVLNVGTPLIKVVPNEVNCENKIINSEFLAVTLGLVE